MIEYGVGRSNSKNKSEVKLFSSTPSHTSNSYTTTHPFLTDEHHRGAGNMCSLTLSNLHTTDRVNRTTRNNMDARISNWKARFLCRAQSFYSANGELLSGRIYTPASGC